MSASAVVEVLIGLSFVYVLLSVICSALNEAIAGVLALRQGTLRRGVEAMLGDAGLADRLFAHPLVQSLCHGTGRRKSPAYIPAELFAAALQDVLAEWTPAAGSRITSVNQALTALLAGVQAGEDAILKQRKTIGDWFDAAMSSVGGAYKRRAHLIVAVLAVVVTATTNADSLAIARSLWTQPLLRSAIAQTASEWSKQNPPTSGLPSAPVDAWKNANQKLANAFAEVSALNLPLGWQHSPGPGEIPGKVFGLLFTMIAVSLGAPFWFDLLNKLVNLRAASSPPTPGKQPAKNPA